MLREPTRTAGGFEDRGVYRSERASTGSLEHTAAFGEVLLISVPYGALPDLGRDLAGSMAGKIVLETGNPYSPRDGAVAQKVIDSGLGSGTWSARFRPGVRLVRAFNTVWDRTLAQGAHRAGDRIGIPLAGDDREVLATAESSEVWIEPRPSMSERRALGLEAGEAVALTPRARRPNTS